jgi:hypothetical protein
VLGGQLLDNPWHHPPFTRPVISNIRPTPPFTLPPVRDFREQFGPRRARTEDRTVISQNPAIDPAGWTRKKLTRVIWTDSGMTSAVAASQILRRQTMGAHGESAEEEEDFLPEYLKFFPSEAEMERDLQLKILLGRQVPASDALMSSLTLACGSTPHANILRNTIN